MNLLELKEKVSKGMELGAEVVYIKEENLLFGIQSAIHDGEKVVFIKCEDESIKTEDFMSMVNDIHEQRGNVDTYIGNDTAHRESDKPVEFLEFAHFPEKDSIKMLFLNA
ncbi:MAG: hypothetical protein ACRC1Y_03450 [Paraclostridium sp.]